MSGHDEPREADILWDLERRHLEEAEFLFEARDDALDAPHYTLEELGRGLEERLLAHVDALAVGGRVVEERLLTPLLRDVDAYPERVAVAVLACADPRAAIDALLEAQIEELAQGLVRGLALRDDEGLDRLLLEALRGASGLGAASLLELLARRGAPVEPWVADFASRDDARVATAAARSLRFCPDAKALTVLAPLAQSDDPELRHAAIETALLRGIPGAWESTVYWAFTAQLSPMRRSSLLWVAMLGDAAARARLHGLVDDPDNRAHALWAMGFGGSVEAIPRCLPLLSHEELGPLAAEVVSAIAGLPADDERLWLDPPAAEGELPQLVDDNLEADLSLRPEEFLPVPNPEAIVTWWRSAEERFDPALRHVEGRPVGGEAVLRTLQGGPLRRRHALALELAARSSGTLHLGTRGLTRAQVRQLEQLTEHAALTGLDFQRGLPIR